MSDEDEGANAYHLRTFARDVAVPQCWLYKPGVKRSPTATLGSIAVPSWPLSTETLAALATTYAGRVPAKDVVFHGFYDITRHEVMAQSYLLGQLDPEQGEYDEPLEFGKTLAHFAIDTTGDASTLTPATMQAPPHTFATVVYFFPSNCVGGAVTISHGHRTTTYEALDGRFLSFYSTCDVTVAPITAGHRSFAVYYATYDLDDDDSDNDDSDNDYGPTPKYAPPPLPSIQELQEASRNYARNDAIAVTIRLETRSLTPTFDSLVGRRDKAVVDLLLAADVFDIALVRAGGDDAPTLSETLHPLCKTPALVQEVYHQTPLNELAEDTDEYESPNCFLLVWPKANRVRILDYDRTVSLLRSNVDGHVTDDLGLGSLHGIFEAAFRAFYPQPRNRGGRPDQNTYAMASALYDHGDVELIEAFMDVHDHWADDESMANWLLTVLRRFGAARFQHKLHMVKAASAFAAHLVHLAATGDTLAHSVAFDCIPLWWPRMLRDLTSSDCSTKKEELVYLFGIETYLLEHPIDAATSTYLHQRLPDVVVRKVAAYLAPPLASLLDTVRADKCLVNNLPAVLWPQRDSLGRVRLATCVDLAVEYLRSGAERASCYNGHVLYLALLTAGTPAFATVDADVQMRRRCFDFKSECLGLDKTKLTPLQVIVLEEYLRRPTSLALSGYGAHAQAVAASDLSVHIRGLWQMLHATSRINSTTSYLDTTTGFANLVLGRGAHFAAIVKKGAAHATHKVSFLGSADVENLSIAIVLSNVGVDVVEAAGATDERPVHVVADAPLFHAILGVAAKANLLPDLPLRIQGVLMAIGDVVLPDVGLYSAGNSRSHLVVYTRADGPPPNPTTVTRDEVGDMTVDAAKVPRGLQRTSGPP